MNGAVAILSALSIFSATPMPSYGKYENYIFVTNAIDVITILFDSWVCDRTFRSYQSKRCRT